MDNEIPSTSTKSKLKTGKILSNYISEINVE